MQQTKRLTNLGKKTLRVVKTVWVELLVVILLVVFDLVTKKIIASNFELYESKTLIPDFLYFTYTQNKGAAFGMLQGMRVVFLILTVFALALFFFLLFRSRRCKRLLTFALAMIIAGTFGNFYDRLIFGYVRDFVEIVYFGADLPILGSSFAIFNVADAALVIGVILFAADIIFVEKDYVYLFYGRKAEEELKRLAEEKAKKQQLKEKNSSGLAVDADEAVGPDNAETVVEIVASPQTDLELNSKNAADVKADV